MKKEGRIKYDTRVLKEEIKKGMSIERIQIVNFFLNRELILDLADLLIKNPTLDDVMIKIPDNSHLFLEPQRREQPTKIHGNEEENVINFEKYLK